MPKYGVTQAKENELHALMESLGIFEEDLIEKFIRGSGPGGQKINKTSICVYLKHVPSGMEVKCQAERSQAKNRFFARRELCDKVMAEIEGVRSKKEQANEKIRRQKRKRSKRAKEKMLGDKRATSQRKKVRKKVTEE